MTNYYSGQLLAWSEKFVVTDEQTTEANSWLLKLLQKSTIIKTFNHFAKQQANTLINLKMV